MKLKLLTVLFLIAYTLSFTSHFKDFAKELKEGNNAFKEDELHTTIIVKGNKPIDHTKTLVSNRNDKPIIAQITDIEETIKVEVPQNESSLSSFLLGLLGLTSLLLVPMLLIVLFKFFRNLYKGSIVDKNQIGRLKFLAYIQIVYAILGNSLVYFSHIEEQKIADLYNQTLVKSTEYDITLFFIPLILLMIVEVLKQHLRLKEDAELTI
ncbi:DUF2975 domain-containing protein [Myroides marinus]|uniref:hypothetical protein n=1 Tax=Myroides marinus TaxID=703342 RepID=UPI0025759ABD|nr:hypothetical protein [Myroides marinus]MDM1349487.1 DUF2975 domain-containing protein [Myroides marinus]MDM1353852.1 DUF2975 domain-containing protein [Myroides marinus]MDM1356697.1 DUF2975 domain-containing protein [Myroides marinus]MDM1363839.1 DUF2975 domain-containing protein [Myroides marinus]MDM1372120.1 DUF2975 domain-containing protein [Myroides marinus]